MLAAALLTVAAAYLLGSIPTGYLVGRARGLDLRAAGSGNIGATNALRVLGKPAGILVLLGDALKGWAACTLLPAATLRWTGAAPQALPLWLAVIGGLAAVVGHNYTCWLRFKGGKGVATSGGVLLGLMPQALITVLAVFGILLLASRIVSLSSLGAAAALPVAVWFWHRDPILLSLGLCLAVLAFVRHRANLRRLLDGTEPRLGQKPSQPQPAPTPPARP